MDRVKRLILGGDGEETKAWLNAVKERVNENGKGPTFRNCTLFFEFLRELLAA